ncbi:MAG: phosphatase PAP2 family protein, partial [Bacteroidota bacterium]
MLDRLLQWDKETLLYLNNLGTPSFDGFWSTVTHITTWFPLFFLFLLLFALKFPWREALLRIGLLTLLIFTITGLCNWVKIWVKRIRPCNDESVNSLMRMLHTPSD